MCSCSFLIPSFSHLAQISMGPDFRLTISDDGAICGWFAELGQICACKLYDMEVYINRRTAIISLLECRLIIQDGRVFILSGDGVCPELIIHLQWVHGDVTVFVL